MTVILWKIVASTLVDGLLLYSIFSKLVQIPGNKKLLSLYGPQSHKKKFDHMVLKIVFFLVFNILMYVI